MNYRNNTTGAIETKSEILNKHSNISFPSPITNDIIEGLGYSFILEGGKPSITPPYEVIAVSYTHLRAHET